MINPVRKADRKGSAIGRKFEGTERTTDPQRHYFLMRGDVPEFHSAIGAPCGERLAIR